MSAFGTDEETPTTPLGLIIKVVKLDTTLTEVRRAYEQRMSRMEQHIDMLAARRKAGPDWMMIAKVALMAILTAAGSTGIITWPQAQSAMSMIGTQ